MKATSFAQGYSQPNTGISSWQQTTGASRGYSAAPRNGPIGAPQQGSYGSNEPAPMPAPQQQQAPAGPPLNPGQGIAGAGDYNHAQYPGPSQSGMPPMNQNTPQYSYPAPYNQPMAPVDTGFPGAAAGSQDGPTQPQGAAQQVLAPRIVTQLVPAKDRKPRVPLADRDVYMLSLPCQDDPAYYDTPSSADSDSDEDAPRTPANSVPPAVLPTTNRGHKLSVSAPHVRQGRLGVYPHADAGFEPSSSNAKRRKLLSGHAAPPSSGTFAVVPNLHLIPRGAKPRPAPAALPPAPQSPLDLLLNSGTQYALGPKNETLKMLAMSATGLIEEEQPLITGLSRVCAGLRGEGYEFRWTGDEQVRAEKIKEREKEEEHERVKRELKRKLEREERERKEEAERLERKERERKEAEDRKERERINKEAREREQAERVAQEEAAAAEEERRRLEREAEERKNAIEDGVSDTKLSTAVHAASQEDAAAMQPPDNDRPTVTGAGSGPQTGNTGDASVGMDVDASVPPVDNAPALASADRSSSSSDASMSFGALPPLPNAGAGSSLLRQDVLSAAEAATANATADPQGMAGPGPGTGTATENEDTPVNGERAEEDEETEGGETETVRRTSRRVAKRTYGGASGGGSTSDDDMYEDAAEDRRAAAAAVALGKRGRGFDDEDESGVASAEGSRRGDETPPRQVDEELPEYAKRLVDPEVYVRSLFVTEGNVELPAVAPLGAPPPPPGAVDVLSPNEQEVLLHDCLTDLHRFLADSLEYRSRLAEIRDGVLGIERRRKGMWKVVRTVAADWLEEEESQAGLAQE